MTPKRTDSRRAALIPLSRWVTYATAGAASAFAPAQSVEAAIHYSGPINRTFKFQRSATFQLDQPGDSIQLRFHSGTGYAGYAYFAVFGQVGAALAGFYDSGCYPVWASKLQRGQPLSDEPFVPAPAGLLAQGSVCGLFNRRGIGYIGFKFNNGSGDQYGWVRIKTKHEFYDKFILLDYAWGDVGDRVRAGQKISTNEAVPAEGSLGLLAIGATGLLMWRRRFWEQGSK